MNLVSRNREVRLHEKGEYKSHLFMVNHNHSSLDNSTRKKIKMKNKAAIILIVFSFSAFDNYCNAFYRPLPRLLENTLNKILNDQLNRRFLKPNKIVETATKTLELKRCDIKMFRDCTNEEWRKYKKRILLFKRLRFY